MVRILFFKLSREFLQQINSNWILAKLTLIETLQIQSALNDTLQVIMEDTKAKSTDWQYYRKLRWNEESFLFISFNIEHNESLTTLWLRLFVSIWILYYLEITDLINHANLTLCIFFLGYDAGSSDTNETCEWLSELEIKRPELPNFWLIMKVDKEAVTVFFHCR